MRPCHLLVVPAVVIVAGIAPLLPSRTLPPRVSIHNRMLLNRAAINGAATVEVLLLTSPSSMDRIVAAVKSAGGHVSAREPAIGYLRAALPTSGVLSFVGDPAVDAWQIASESRNTWYRDGPLAQTSHLFRDRETEAFARVAPSRPIDRPVLPIELARTSGHTADEDTGLKEWRQRFPTFDGRGVTIAMIESALPDFSHPSIGMARTIDGTEVPKLAGILNPIGPDRFDETRVVLDTEVSVGRSWAAIGPRTYIFPGPGLYRFGTFVMPAGGNLVQQFGVAEKIATGEIRVDADGNADFRDDPPLPDVNERPDARTLSVGRDPAVQVPFVVARGTQPHTVHVYASVGVHQMMTMSVAAGSWNEQSLAAGVAVNARVLLVRAEMRLTDYVEAYIAAARRPDVDVICDATALTLLPETSDDFIGTFMRRIGSTYDKLIVHAANNMRLVLNSARSPGDALAVGGSLGPSVAAAIYGATLEGLVVNPAGAAGPGLDGAIRPDIVAPMHMIAADLQTRDNGIGLPASSPHWRLPAGYRIGCCTSTSAPYAAGLAALLVSAAKQRSIPYTRDTLARAIRLSARFIAGTPAHHQGNGVFDINAAWQAMLHPGASVRIDSTAEIVHPLAGYTIGGPTGPGLLEREEWRIGGSGRRVITLIRHDGPSDSDRYRVSWTGNDGTFSSAPFVRLPLNTPVALTVHVDAAAPGAHSALLNLHHPATDAIVFRTQATIVAAHEFDAATHTLNLHGSIPLMREHSHYFRVPETIDALTVRLRVRRGRLNAAVVPSHGVYSSYYRHVHPSGGRQFGPGEHVVTLSRPAAGVWALSLINDTARRTGEADSDAAEYSVEIALDACKLRAARQRDGRFALQIASQMRSPRGLTATFAFGTLASRRARLPESGLPVLLDIDVPEHTGTLVVRARSDGREPLEIHLYDCSTLECFSYAFTIPARDAQAIAVRRPAAGRWMAAVNSAPAPTSAGTVIVDTILARHPQPIPLPEGTSGVTSLPPLVDVGSPPPFSAGSQRVVMFELFDRQMERDERLYPWEDRAGVERLADRPVAIGTTIYRID